MKKRKHEQTHIDWMVERFADHLLMDNPTLKRLSDEADRSSDTSRLYISGYYGYLLGGQSRNPKYFRRIRRGVYGLTPRGWARVIQIRNEKEQA